MKSVPDESASRLELNSLSDPQCVELRKIYKQRVQKECTNGSFVTFVMRARIRNK